MNNVNAISCGRESYCMSPIEITEWPNMNCMFVLIKIILKCGTVTHTNKWSDGQLLRYIFRV